MPYELSADSIKTIILNNIVEDGTCWRWTEKMVGGYGYINLKGVSETAVHRLSWEAFHGQYIFPGNHVHHECENPWCCNPTHLISVTPLEHARIHNRLDAPAVREERRRQRRERVAKMSPADYVAEKVYDKDGKLI